MGPRTSTWLRRNSDPVRMDDMKYLFLRVFFFFSFSKWKKILFYLLDVSKLMGPRTSTWLRRNRHPLRMDGMKYFFLEIFSSFLFPNGPGTPRGPTIYFYLFLFLFISILQNVSKSTWSSTSLMKGPGPRRSLPRGALGFFRIFQIFLLNCFLFFTRCFKVDGT